MGTIVFLLYKKKLICSQKRPDPTTKHLHLNENKFPQ
jgi:hypothetical protein